MIGLLTRIAIYFEPGEKTTLSLYLICIRQVKPHRRTSASSISLTFFVPKTLEWLVNK